MGRKGWINSQIWILYYVYLIFISEDIKLAKIKINSQLNQFQVDTNKVIYIYKSKF